MKRIITISILFLQANSLIYSQDTTFRRYDSLFYTYSLKDLEFTYQPSFNYIHHSPDDEDEKIYQSYKHLIDRLPTEENHATYIQLATALWNLEKIAESEKMFLNIVNSTIQSYTTTYFHSSDIPGDTTTNSYGYGSCTSNYKNTACLYLTKIYIEKKKFQTALKYLDLADKKYEVYYTCGTGSKMQRDKFDFLYAACYEGLGYHRKNIDNLLPTCLDWDNAILVNAIKRTYSKREITDYLKQAETSITCVVDTFPSKAWRTTNSGGADEKTDTLRYYSGTGTIMLFNRKIDLPYPHLEDGESVSREYYVKLFKGSSFYKDLIDQRKGKEDE